MTNEDEKAAEEWCRKECHVFQAPKVGRFGTEGWEMKPLKAGYEGFLAGVEHARSKWVSVNMNQVRESMGITKEAQGDE